MPAQIRLSSETEEATPAREGHGRSGQRYGSRLLRRATTVSLLTGLGVATGFLVDVLIAARFGISAETDAFLGGYTIPLILVTCLAAVQPVLVTVLTACRDDSAAFSLLVNSAGLVACTVAAAGALLAVPLVQIITPGFSAPTARQAAHLARILFARVPLAAVAEVCKAELYARHRFGLATFSNTLPSLVTVVLLLLTGPALGIEVAAYAYVLGSLVQAALLLGMLLGPLRVPYRLKTGRSSEVLGQTARLTWAPLVGLLLRQGVTLAERFFGSFLSPGSVTALTYASRLTMTVAGISFDGLNTAALPSLTKQWMTGAGETVRGELQALLKFMLYGALPIGLSVAALSIPLVRLFFERGEVDRLSAQFIGSVLGVYSLSLPFLGPFRAVQTLFYAAREMRPVVLLHGGLVVLTLILDLVLVRPMGAMGLALAFVLGCGMMTVVGLLQMARHVRVFSGQDLAWKPLAGSAWRLALASGAMATTMFVVVHWIETMTLANGKSGVLLTLAIAALAGVTVFLGLGAVLRLEAISIVSRVLRVKLHNHRHNGQLHEESG